MSEPSPRILSVRRQPTDWRAAQYDRAQVAGLHWRDVSGGVNASLPHPFVHGYVLCNAMISAELPHSCRHGPPQCSRLLAKEGQSGPMARHRTRDRSGSRYEEACSVGKTPGVRLRNLRP
jgi:hypothetical protein